MENQQLFKRLLYTGGIMVALLVVYLVAINLSRSGKTAVIIDVAPSDSTVTVDGKEVGAGKIYFSPGNYSFNASRPYFEDDKVSVSVKAKGGEVFVDLLPEAKSDEAKLFLEENPDVQAAREVVGGHRANSKGLQIEKQTPLITKLPFTSIDGPFTIDYGPSPTRKNGTFLIVSDSSPEGRVAALKWIRQQGYDPTDFEIQFDDFVNPTFNYSGAE